MKKFAPVFLFLSIYMPLRAQQIQTAGAFFRTVSDFYAGIRDYEADVQIAAGSTAMQGRVSFKRPDLLRVDFTRPNRQVIVFNGDVLTVYLPGRSAILNQSVRTSEARLATAQGLSLMSRHYTIAYETSRDAVPLEEGSEERVVKLLLTRKSASEGFSTIRLAINPDSKLIRRVEAATPQKIIFAFNFSGYRLNQGIPDQRFIYDPPPSANNYNNFLFSE